MAAQEDRAKSHGLSVLYGGERGVTSIDIVAVPGLAARPSTSFDSFKTVNQKPAFNWLSDDEGIKRDYQAARVMLFEYDSRWIGKERTQTNIANISTDLLYGLVERRKEDPTRPLIFIGHSMGALVVARAVNVASHRADEFPNIYLCFAGALFLGGPFKGSTASNLGALFAFVAEKVDHTVVSRALTYLEPENEALIELREEFARVSNKLEPKPNILCAFETKPTNAKEFVKWAPWGHNAIIVTEDSACLEMAERFGLDCDHRRMNRFDSSRDREYEKIQERLRPVLKKASALVRKRVKAASAVMNDRDLSRLLSTLVVPSVETRKKIVTQLSGISGWIRDDPQFKDWATTHGTHGDTKILWIYGQQGRSKSKSAVTAIDYLESQTSHRDDNAVVAYFFCDSTEDLRSATNVLKSILWQLISNHRWLAQYAKSFVPNDKSKAKAGAGGSTDALFTVSSMWKTLQTMLDDNVISTGYFVINCLHELSDDDGTRELMELITNSAEEQSNSGERRASVRWLFTSRPRPNIRKVLSGKSGVVEVNVDDEKYAGPLKRDMKDHAKRRVADLAAMKRYNPALRYFASSLVESKVEDNSFWVDVVCRKMELLPPNHVEVRKSLEGVSQDLHTLLEEIWSSVLKANSADVDWVKEILRALILVYEDPTLEELGILTEIPASDGDDASTNKLLDAVENCGPLIKLIDLEGGVLTSGRDDLDPSALRVTFLHSDAREYLQNRAEELLGLGKEEMKWQHGVLALRCFTNVLKGTSIPKDLDDEPDNSQATNTEVDQAKTPDQPEEEKNDIESIEALEYSLKYWLRHARDATVDIVDDLNLNEAFWQISSDLRTGWWEKYTDANPSYSGLHDMTALHIAALFGMTPLVSSLLKYGHGKEMSMFDSWDNTPLHWAADQGHIDVMELLLDKGSDINGGSEKKVWTPLHMAASTGETEAIKFLLSRDPPANVNAWADDNGTPLTLAISYQNLDSVQALVEHHADVTVADPHGNSPFAMAAEIGNEEILDLVWKAGGYRNLQSKEYGCPLAAAAYGENVAVVGKVLQVDNSPASGQKALEKAAEVASQDIVDFLLKNFRGLECENAFANANAWIPKESLESFWEYSGHRITKATLDKSLYQATDYEQEDKVKSLLSMGASPDARGDEYGNALTASAFDGTIDIVSLLLEQGANLHSKEGFPLHAAASQGNLDVVEKLIASKVDINSISTKSEYGTALQAACATGFIDTVDLLLKHGANPNLGGGVLTNPITAAVLNNEPAIMAKLIAAGVNTNVLGGSDMTTPLINAAAVLQAPALETLIVQGRARVNTVDKDGDTALKIAARFDDSASVKLLLDHGADYKHKEGHNGTALHSAAARGSISCCKMLLDRGASLDVVAGPYATVLQAAADSGDYDTLKTILDRGKSIDINKKGGEHTTALHAAAMQQDYRCCSLLLDKGSETNIVDLELGSPMHAAAASRRNRNVAILLDRGADPNITGGKYGNVLQAAAAMCPISTVQKLLDAGAKLDVPPSGKYGNALVAAASRPDDTEVLELLLQKPFKPAAFEQALNSALKYELWGNFDLIWKSPGGKALAKNTRANLKKGYQLRKKASIKNDEEADENSDFDGDEGWTWQDEYDSDDLEQEEDDNEEEEETEGDGDEKEQETTQNGAPRSMDRSLGSSSQPQQYPAAQTSTANGYAYGSAQGAPNQMPYRSRGPNAPSPSPAPAGVSSRDINSTAGTSQSRGFRGLGDEFGNKVYSDSGPTNGTTYGERGYGQNYQRDIDGTEGQQEEEPEQQEEEPEQPEDGPEQPEDGPEQPEDGPEQAEEEPEQEEEEPEQEEEEPEQEEEEPEQEEEEPEQEEEEPEQEEEEPEQEEEEPEQEEEEQVDEEPQDEQQEEYQDEEAAEEPQYEPQEYSQDEATDGKDDDGADVSGGEVASKLFRKFGSFMGRHGR